MLGGACRTERSGGQTGTKNHTRNHTPVKCRMRENKAPGHRRTDKSNAPSNRGKGKYR
jgi:hypothetical protein